MQTGIAPWQLNWGSPRRDSVFPQSQNLLPGLRGHYLPLAGKLELSPLSVSDEYRETAFGDE